MEFKNYAKTRVTPMTPYEEGMELPETVAISEADRANGSPKAGDMIARNPDNAEDMWLVAEEYFLKHYSEVPDISGKGPAPIGLASE